jgi:hypothetical protein
VLARAVPALIKIGFLAAAVAVVAAVIHVRSRPSEELTAARELVDKAKDLEKEARTEEALAVVRELASMQAEEEELLPLTQWGRERVEELEGKISLTELGELSRAFSDTEETETDGLSDLRAKTVDLADRFPKVRKLQRGTKGLISKIDARVAAVRHARKEAMRKAHLDAARSALAEAGDAVQGFLDHGRFADARLAIKKARQKAGESPQAILTQGLSRLESKTLQIAIVAYAQEDRRARAFVARKQLTDARNIYQVVIETYGFEHMVRKARERLASIASAATAETTQAAGKKVSDVECIAEIAAAHGLVRTFDYDAALERLDRASDLVEGGAVQDGIELLREVIGRERATLGRISAVFRAEPVDLKFLGVESPSGRTQAFTEADDKTYTVTVTARRGGASSITRPWSKMPALHICKLAEFATKDMSYEAMIDLSIFCRGHGGIVQGAAAAVKARGIGGDAAKSILERLSAYPHKFTESGAREGRAHRTGTKGADPAGDDQREIPTTIDMECIVCSGSGVTRELGCAYCRATGYRGIVACRSCRGDGRSAHRCPPCGGRGTTIQNGKRTSCARCRGKGVPICYACAGSGETKKYNPMAAGYPTRTCPQCKGVGIDQSVAKCRYCMGIGKMEVRDTSRQTPTVRRVTCNFCDGRGRRTPFCTNCVGRGYVRPARTDKLSKARVTCRPCFGTGRMIRKCRGCIGRGYVKAEE